ncbi:MAG: DEAD/DEAH box helicase [Myxococcales bacterium]|nr:MAG: DEAD/DEAH box helicase [Myxococcales bacterium]
MNPSVTLSENNKPQSHDAFAALGLCETLQRNLDRAGYSVPTPIQKKAIPHVLQGKDLLGCAQTGTGKTAAFALPILQKIMQESRPAGPVAIQTLVLAPTRELAAQIGASFSTYAGRGGPISYVVFGGVSKHGQLQALRRGVEVLVATPGRLLDLMNDGVVKLDRVHTFVLDEADRMLDMGFIHDVRRITRALPSSRQTLLFSATMPAAIQELADRILRNPVQVAVDPVSSTRAPIEQSVHFVEKSKKTSLLIKLLGDKEIDRALVFTRTKHGANRVVRNLLHAKVGAAAIHGNKSQSARVRALEDFKAGRVRVVVATDIAARGIDIKDLSHVINFDLPNEPESYVHRVGRTGRAGASGIAISFCSDEERPYLRAIERLTKRDIAQRETPSGLMAAKRNRSPSAFR